MEYNVGGGWMGWRGKVGKVFFRVGKVSIKGIEL